MADEQTPKPPTEPNDSPVDSSPSNDVLDDPKTDRAVDDIVVHESDELLEQQDSLAADNDSDAPKGNIFARWWHSKKAHWITFAIVFFGLVTLAGIPTTRYWIMNTLGVRVTASVTVVDSLTGQPLKNVAVTLGSASAKTDSEGKAKVTQVRLGPTQLKLLRSGFAAVTDDVTIGWGSNPLGNFQLKSVGMQYKLKVQDALTAQPIQGAEASAGEATAVSDKNGIIVLTIPGTGNNDVEISVAGSGFRAEKVTIKGQTAGETTVRLLTAQKAVFINKDSGKYDLFTSDADGQNRRLVMPGTGTENANIALTVSPGGDHAALVSTRDNQRSADGSLLVTLTLINLTDGTSISLAHAEQIQLVDWVGTRLIFEQVAGDASSAATRYAIISYDYANTNRVQVATGRHITTVLSARGVIYYAVAEDSQDTSVKPALYKVTPDATNRQIVLDKEIWTTYRTDYNTLNVQTADGWYSVALSSGSTASIGGPSSYSSRLYSDNADASKSLWINTAQGVLSMYEVAGAKDMAVHTQTGVTYPLRWLTSTTAIYRVVTSTEVADYAISVLGDQPPIKIADVVNTYGFTQGQ